MVSFDRHQATRYAAPLKEGGSLPAVVDTDRAGLWVVKFVGAGQGARALIAELIVGEVARHIGLPVPGLSLVEVDPSFGKNEGDPEIRDLLRASVGTNVGMQFLEAGFNYDSIAAADLVDPALAAKIVWLDAFAMNIDRTARNPNMMVSGDQIWLIDHGAALYFHHAWAHVTPESMVRPFAQIDKHVLLPQAASITDADSDISLDREVLAAIVAAVPDELLMHAPQGMKPAFGSAAQFRKAYIDALGRRLEDRSFVAGAEAARQELA